MIRVIDNFLPPEDFLSIQKEVSKLEYSPVTLGNDPFYKLDSGVIHKSARKYWPDKTGPFEKFFERMLELNLPTEEFSMMVHVYQPGAELTWHNDGHLPGAYTFYIHDDWESNWGGELMISDPVKTEVPSRGVLDHRQDVLDPGMGRYVMPIPNRLVIMEGNEIHKVARAIRTRKSFTGFFR